MHGRAHIVDESGEGQRGGARAATDGLLRFEHRGAQAGLRQDNGRSQTIRPGADHESFAEWAAFHRKLNFFILYRSVSRVMRSSRAAWV